MTSPNYTYDPVTAIDEAKATGQTAQIFDDIRTTMEIPIVTSIWRGLATMDDSLSKVWTAAKPIYTTGAPLNALNAMPNALELPVPKSLFSPQLQKLGIRPDDLQQIRNIINAYNKSNGMNLMALSALIKFGVPQKTFASPKPTHIPKDLLPELLQKEEIKPARKRITGGLAPGDKLTNTVVEVDRGGVPAEAAAALLLVSYICLKV